MAHVSIISSQNGEHIFEGAPRYVGAYLKPGYLEFLEIGSPTAIDWHVGDYIVYSRTGKTYRLYRTPQTVEQGNTQRYGAAFLYENVQFFDDSKQLELCPFTDLVPGDNTIHFSTQNIVSFFGKPLNVAERLQACLEAQYGSGSWEVRIVTTTDADILELLDTEVEFSVSGANCQQALDKVYELWNGLGWIHSVENGVNIITIGASNVRTSANTTVPFAYDNGLVRVERSVANADEIGTRLFAYGSMTNMDATYYRGLDIKDAESVDIEHLMIPLANWGKTDGLPDARKAYIEDAAAIAKLGLIPRTAYFDGTGDLPDIHPTIERMTIGEVYDAGGAGYLPNLSKWSRSQRIDEVVSPIVNPEDHGTSAERGQKYTEDISAHLASLTDAFINNDTVSWTIFTASTIHAGRLTLNFGQEPQPITLATEWTPQLDLKLAVYSGGKRAEFPLTIRQASQTVWQIILPESVSVSGSSSGLVEVRIEGVITNTVPGQDIVGGTFSTDASTTVTGGVEYELSKTFTITIPQIGFDIEKYAALGNGKTISMKTGMCAGRDFEIKSAKYVSSTDSWLLSIYRSSDEDLGIMFPNVDYQIAAGDQYVLLDIAMPDMYVTVASNRLLEAARKLLADISSERPFYSPQIDAKVVYNESRVLLEGMWMDVAFDAAREYVLIDSITIDENGSNIPTYEVSLRERKGVEWTENVGKSSSSKSSVSVNGNDVEQSGGVTSVGMTVPEGLTVQGSPITGAGIFKVGIAEGYKIPLVSELTGFFEIDTEHTFASGKPAIKLKSIYEGLWSPGFISAGGLSDGGGSEGGLTWAALAAATSEQINLSHLTGALGGYYTKAQVDALIGGISGFSYEIYPSLSSVTDPKSNVLYLIGPTGTGTDKYEEYVYSNNAWTKIGDTSIDLSGYVQHADLLPLAEAIAANDLRIRSFEDWLLNPSFDDLPVYSLSAQELNLGGYLFDGEGIDRAISLAGSAIQPADLKQLTFQAGAFAAISYNPASPATVNIPSSIAHLTDANRVSTLEGRFDANGKLNFASLPALYLARTQVKSYAANDVLLGITAISNAASSDGTDKSRIEWDATNEAWHFIGSLYADGFVSAGGISTGSGAEGTTLSAVWASLTANSDEYAGRKIDLNHLPYTAGDGISITNGIISATNAGTVTSIKLGTTSYGPVSGVVSLPAYPTTLPASDVYDWAKAETKPSYAFSEITGTLSVTQVPTIPISKTLGLEAALAAKMDLDSEIPLTEGIATNDRRIASLEDWLLSPALDALSVYSLDAAEISLAGAMLGDYLAGLSDGISAEAQARSAADDTINGAITTLDGRTTTLEGYFTGGSAKSAQTAARLSGNTSYTAWGQTYWSNGVPGSISGNMTSVGSISMNGAISGATTISASGQASVGSLKLASGAPTLTWDSANSAWHLSGNFYADGFISAGGVSPGGGASGIDLAAMWSSLTNATSDPYANYKIAAAHIPDMASTYGYATQTWVSQQGYLTSASLSGYATQSWVNSQGFVTSSGVTSVGLSAPTGFSVTGSPVTSSGMLALAFASGYSLPTTAKQTNWDTAYGWGNHASEGYLKATTAAATYETIANANLSELSLAEGISSNEDRLTALEGWLASPALDELLVRSFGADEVETGRLLAESASISAISLAGADLATTLSGFALKTTTVTGTGYLTGGGDLSANRTIDIASTYKTRIDNGNTAYGWGNHASAGYLTASEAANTYVTLSTAQTISGAKTFSTTLHGADSEWSDGRSSLRLIAANGYTYIQSSTAAHDASADMYLTGLYGGVGSYLYLRFSNVYAYSNIVADGAITAGSASDARLKGDVRNLDTAFARSVIMASRPVAFVWDEKATELSGGDLKGRDYGLIAQEVEGLLPQAIGSIWGDYKRLDYTKYIAPLIAVEQDHERRIVKLERENKELRKRLNMN